MGSAEWRKSKSGKSGISPRRGTPSLLMEELSLETLQDSTYVRLISAEHAMISSLDDAEAVFEVSPRGSSRSEKAWSWLKRPVTSWNGRDGKETVIKTLQSCAWLGRPPADEFHFDPSRRWPQGW